MSNRSGVGLQGNDLQSQLRKFGDLVWLSPSANPNLGKIAPLAEFLRDGLLAYADGTNWNPGFGKGYYRYELATTSWKLAIPVAVNKTIALGTGVTNSGGATLTKAYNTVGYKFGLNDETYINPFELPYEWDIATNAKYKIHWYSTNTTASRFVKFQINYNSTAENTELISATTTPLDTGDIAVPTTAYLLNESTITIQANTLALDDVVSILFKRIAAVGTAPAAGDHPVITSMEIEYQTNKLGEAL